MATTMARPALPTLETPQSATFPSEIASPLVASPTVFRPVEPLKTPLTPPPAYLDFLAKKSPALSPPASATMFPRSATEKPALTSTPSTESFTSTKSTGSTTSSSSSVSEASSSSSSEASTRIETSATVSTTLEETVVTESTNDKKEASPSDDATNKDIKEEAKPPVAMVKSHARRISMPPPSPYGGPNSARSPRRLVIPQSPYSPRVQSPLSAGGMVSPYAIVSPRERDSSEVVSFKQVVTRTMQLVRPPQAPIMEPVPASKKRKLEHDPSN